MISHVHIGVTEFERALRFYEAVMRSVGAKQRFIERERPWAGWQPGDAERPLLLVGRPFDGGPAAVGNGQMTALLAPNRAAVVAAYEAALANGGSCDGKPGLRPEYHANYFGAYFRDPDGNKLCVCCHDAE